MILVLAGTSEGRETAVSLEKEGKAVMASTATVYGGELLAKEFQGDITTRPLNPAEMLQLIKDKQISKVVDATHPFAVQVSRNAREACRQSGTLYERLERNTEMVPEGEGVIRARDLEEAVQLAAGAAGTEGNVFITTGSSKLEQYTAVLDPENLVARILPVRDSLDKCLSLGISPKNIIAMQGPFDEQLNRLLFRRYNAKLVITKESGSTGGTIHKINAAAALRIPVILISRPQGQA